MNDIPLKIDIKEIKSEMSDKTSGKKNLDFRNFKNKTNLSKSQKISFDKNYYYKKDFLKNKRKKKIKTKIEIPDTPHNTGQYLCHIYQANESKDKKSQKENENNDLGLNFFEDNDEDNDDFFDDLEYKIDEDSKRERLMSMDGKEMENFLMSPEDKKDGKKLFKSANLLEKSENNFGFNLDEIEESPIIEEK